MRYLVDTNVISETRRKVPDANVLAWFRRTDPAAIYVSVLSLGEIAKGCAVIFRREPRTARALLAWLDGLKNHYADRLIAIDADIAEEWGRLSAVRSLPVIDSLMTATASVHNMTLVTRNLRDIDGTGVAILNPWKA